MVEASSQGSSQSALGRGFQLLQWVVEHDRPVSSVEAAEALKLPKPTVHRVALQLEEIGLLQRAPNSRKFVGGPQLRDLSLAALSHGLIGSDRHAILQNLSEEIEETCNCTVLDGNRLVYFDRVEANWPMRIHLPVGSRVPLHATAGGKMFLAMVPSAQRQRLLDSLDFEAHTALTITDRDALEQQLAQIRKSGVSEDRGEFLDGLIALAVPVFDQRKRVCFVIAVHAPTVRRSIEELYQFLPAVRRAAEQLSQTL